MKVLISIFVIIIYSQIAFGQERVLSADSDTVFWAKYYKSIFKNTGLADIKNVNAEFFFRFWDGYRAIEIAKTNSKIIGNVTFILRQCKRNKEGRLYYRKIQLTYENSIKIQNLVLKYGLIELPTDKMIKGWKCGFDGITYFTEFADQNTYSSKNYWTPTAYENLPEARQLINFIGELNKIQELTEKGDEFMRTQPFKSWYSNNGSEIIVIKRKHSN
jgi:hypothetical protein